MYKSKLNEDQRLILKIKDLPVPQRRSYIQRLSSQAISHIVAHIASSTKWNYQGYDSSDRWTNDHLKCSIEYDHITESIHFFNKIIKDGFVAKPEDVFSPEEMEDLGLNTPGVWK